MRFHAPWPISPRDICLYGYGVDMLEESNSVAILVRSCTPQDPHDHPSIPRGTVRASTKYAGFLLTPQTESTTIVRTMTNSDPKIDYVPYTLLNLVTKHLAPYFFTMLRTQAVACTTAGSPYNQRIQTNPIYEDMRKMLERFNLNANQINS